MIYEHFKPEYNENDIQEALKVYNFNVSKEVIDSNENFQKGVATTTKQLKQDQENQDADFSDDNFPTEPNFIIIKIHYDTVEKLGNLYDATRHAWKVKYDTVVKYRYALSVIDGIVKEVYVITRWEKAQQWQTDDCNVSDRLQFIGEIATEEIRQQFVGKKIPYKYRKNGMASPVVISK